MPRTRSQSELVSTGDDKGWGVLLGDRIDEAVERLSSDHEVITVTITPVYAKIFAKIVAGHTQLDVIPESASTKSVLVTVVWRVE